MTDQLSTLLRRLRAEAGLTQEQLAERSELGVRTIRRLEKGGSTDHRMGTVNRLADALGVGEEDRRRLAAALTASSPRPAPEPEPEPGSKPGPEPEPEPGPDVAASAPPLPPLSPALAAAAAELASEIRHRWQHEEDQRRVHDPFPLPVRWQEAPAEVTDRPDNVRRLGPGAVAHPVDLDGDLRSVTRVYRRIPSGRLVVLGRAGSGKSVLTIRFVLDLLGTRTVPERVPVIFSLGSWDPATTALRDWMVDLLLRDHPHLVGRAPNGSTLAAALVDTGLVLPVLDGFDEIAEGLRRDALEALNATSSPLVLTSRREEFTEAVGAAGTPLVWAAGIELTDLTAQDLADYLPRTARPARRLGGGAPASPWAPVLGELGAAGTPEAVRLARVLSTPLMVVLARTMYSDAPGRDPVELLDAERFPADNALEEHLLAGFVPTLYRRRARPRGPGTRPRPARERDPDHALRWLGYLADHLARLGRDQHDLAWWQLGASLPRATRIVVSVLASALCVTGAEWLAALVVLALPLGSPEGIGTFDRFFVEGLVMGPIAGLSFGSVYGTLAAFGHRAFEPTRVRLRMPRTRHDIAGPRLARSVTGRFAMILAGGFVMGTGCAFAVTTERTLFFGAPAPDAEVIRGTLVNVLAFGLVFGLASGLVFGLTMLLEAPLDTASAATPVTLLSANRTTVTRQALVLAPLFTLTVALGGALLVDLLQPLFGPMYWPLRNGLFIGLVSGIGGTLSYVLVFTAWGQWAVLVRVWLPLTGRLPWDVVAFLDDAYRRGALRRSGAVHQFRHVRLQHHLGHAYRRDHAHHRPPRYSAPRAASVPERAAEPRGASGRRTG